MEKNEKLYNVQLTKKEIQFIVKCAEVVRHIDYNDYTATWLSTKKGVNADDFDDSYDDCVEPSGKRNSDKFMDIANKLDDLLLQ